MATFTRESNLRTHMEKHIPKSDWIWFCKMCSQTFASEGRLKVRVHTVVEFSEYDARITVLLKRNRPLVHKYYINRVGLSQDYIP